MLPYMIIKKNKEKKNKILNDKYNDFNFNIFKFCNNVQSNDPQLILYIDTLNNNPNMIYSLKTFYNNYPEFDYYTYRELNKEKFMNMTEVEVILYWLNNKTVVTKNLKYHQKNILIYPHIDFNLRDGGITVHYYFAQLLDKFGIKVRINTSSFINANDIFNNFYDNEFDLNNTIVIYCEGVVGNPLNAPYVVRWMLSELGKNVPYDNVNTWGKNELVYYFNSELKFNKSPEKIGNIYKLLTLLYISSKIKTYNNDERHGYCYTYRKSHMHKKINKIHPDDSFEITVFHTQEDYVEIFNKYKYFISYDPLTFLSIIAPLCGCISIIYPLDGVSKKEWLEMSAVSEYFKQKNEYLLYGVAYGNTPEELDFAQSTIHLVKKQWDDIANYEFMLVQNFINDINIFDQCNNTIQNNYF